MSGYPAGTMTFLSVDLAPATPMAAGTPDRPAELDRLRRLLAEVAHRHQGDPLTGDPAGTGGLATFALASAAATAAVSLLQRLQAEASAAVAPLRVRAALHTGVAVPGNTLRQATGSAIGRCACLRDIAHGGQVLLSLVTAELLRDELPAGAQLRVLGSCRLRDLARPEQVYQLCHPGLPADFPPPRSLDVLPHNLPMRLTSFVGREREQAAVQGHLAVQRLVTLAGAGGCGKTSLALQVAAALVDSLADGAWLVDLAPVRDPDLVPQAVAGALGVREEPGRPLAATLADYCRPRQLLLVLDNCEHLVSACAALVDRLLQACPQLRVLATSREALSVAGELVWRVLPLTLPDPGRQPSLDSLSQYEAVRLFIDRALAIRPGFAVTNQNAPAVAQICHRLDGIPLALELAAARVEAMTPSEIAARLDDRFRLLTGGSRAALPRHQTLRAAVEWSHDLLSPPEQVVFRRLSVFNGGFKVAAAEAVCSDPSGAGAAVDLADVLSLLAQLVHKSMVLAEDRAGETRYRMLETVREFAEEQLRAADEETALRPRHRDWYLDLAEQAEPELAGFARVGRPDEVAWQVRLHLEAGNLRAALGWCLDQGAAAAGLRLGAALVDFWNWNGYLNEGRRWLNAFLERAPAPTPERGKALAAVGRLTRYAGDFPQADALYQQSLAVWRELGDGRAEAQTCFGIGELARLATNWDRAAEYFQLSRDLWRREGDWARAAAAMASLWSVLSQQGPADQAEALFLECLNLGRQSGDPRLLAQVLQELAHWALCGGDERRAEPLAAETLALTRELGDQKGTAHALNTLGRLSQLRGDPVRAEEWLEESLALRRAIGFKWYIADSLCALAQAVREQGRYGRAAILLTEGLGLRREIGDRWGVAWVVSGAASLAAAMGAADKAAMLFGAAAARWAAIGPTLRQLADRRDEERSVAVARQSLGEAAYAAAWARGHALAEAEAMAQTLGWLTQVSQAEAGASPAGAAAPAPPQPAAGATGSRAPASAPAGPPATGRLAPARGQSGAPPAGLTPREVEIVQLVAEGLTDRAAAARLFISPRTVDTHLRNIFGKVNVSNRAGLVAWAARHGLTGDG